MIGLPQSAGEFCIKPYPQNWGTQIIQLSIRDSSSTFPIISRFDQPLLASCRRDTADSFSLPSAIHRCQLLRLIWSSLAIRSVANRQTMTETAVPLNRGRQLLSATVSEWPVTRSGSRFSIHPNSEGVRRIWARMSRPPDGMRWGTHILCFCFCRFRGEYPKIEILGEKPDVLFDSWHLTKSVERHLDAERNSIIKFH
jgi:hypothetical protein